MKRSSSRVFRFWETFHRIPQPSASDVAPVVDAEWLASRGVYPGAPAVINLIRGAVLPLVRELERKRGLARCVFLVHDKDSGVPTTPDDQGQYLHLRLVFKRPTRFAPSGGWCMTRPMIEGVEIGGINREILRGGDVSAAWDLIGRQSAWVLDLIEAHEPGADPAAMVKQARQFLHYFANMLQTKVVG
jgi:hypothetical protein